MKPKIVAFGNTIFNAGYALAADLSLAGYDVNFIDLPESSHTITPIKKQGGITLDGDPNSFISGKTGLAKLKLITSDLKKGLEDTNIIFIDTLPTEYESRVKAIAPYLEDGQIIHFSGYGYWPALRVANILKNADKEEVTITENQFLYSGARFKNTGVTCRGLRGYLPLGVFPAKRRQETFNTLKNIYPTFELMKNVLQTNIDNPNLLVHPGISLLNIGYFDNAKNRGEGVDFYKTGNTTHTGTLIEAQDKEKIKICSAYALHYTSINELMIRTSNVKGDSVYELLKNTKRLQGTLLPADIWIKWVKTDMSYSAIPLVSLAELAGICTPIHRALITIFGAVLGIDFWKTGLTLDKLGLKGLTSKEIIQYVTEGYID